MPGKACTSARPAAIWSSNCASAYCGCTSSLPTARHKSSLAASSKPGNTTAPRGRRAITANKSAVARMEPVEPAAIIGRSGGSVCQFAQRFCSKALRRAVGSICPNSCNCAGQKRNTILSRATICCQFSANSSGAKSSSRSSRACSFCVWSRKRSKSCTSADNFTALSGVSSAALNRPKPPCAAHFCTNGSK